MIKEHLPYTIDDAVFNIRSKVLSKTNDFNLLKNLPDVDFLINENKECFQASVVCVYLKLNFEDTSKNMFIYETIIPEVKNIMCEDINCIDIFAIGNCIYGIFYTPIKESMKFLVDCMAKIHSTLILFENISKLENLNYKIAADYGDVYFVNFEKNTTNNYHWFGNIFDNVLDKARKEPVDNYVYITDLIRANITENYQNFFKSEEMPWFKANMVNTIFSKWKDNG